MCVWINAFLQATARPSPLTCIFRQSQDYPAGAVLSVGLFLVTMVVTFLQFVLLDRRVHYGDA